MKMLRKCSSNLVAVTMRVVTIFLLYETYLDSVFETVNLQSVKKLNFGRMETKDKRNTNKSCKNLNQKKEVKFFSHKRVSKPKNIKFQNWVCMNS